MKNFIHTPIFAITTFNLVSEPQNTEIERWKSVERTRCVGFYYEFELAEETVLINNGDINENGYYSHVIIEKIEPGLYPTSAHTNRWFYKWDGEKYVKLKFFNDPLFDVISYAPIG